MIIRKLRLDMGLSQEQLADMAGISTRTLQRLERGAKASPETLKCLAAVLEVDFKDLNKEPSMTPRIGTPDIASNEPQTSHAATAQPELYQPALEHPAKEAAAQFEQPTQAPTACPLPELSDDEQAAMEYVRDIKSFYSHAATYACVMLLLLVINLLTNPGYFWVVWPALGWGIGLVIQGLNTFEVINLLGDDWERKQIQRRLKRKN